SAELSAPAAPANVRPFLRKSRRVLMARLLQSIDDSYHNAPSRSLVSPFPLATARIRPPSAAILGTSVGNGKGNDRRGERRRPEADTPPRGTPCLHQPLDEASVVILPREIARRLPLAVLQVDRAGRPAGAGASRDRS